MPCGKTMPYYHEICGGQIPILTRRCKKCGKQWPIKVWFTPNYPDDMYLVPKETPRWLNMVVRISFLVFAVLGFIGIVSFFKLPWGSALGLLLVTVIVIVIALQGRIKKK